MRKQKNISSWLGKIILIFLTVFSQVHTPLEVLAEEINDATNDNETSVKENTKGDNNVKTQTNEENNVPDESLNNSDETTDNTLKNDSNNIDNEETTSQEKNDSNNDTTTNNESSLTLDNQEDTTTEASTKNNNETTETSNNNDNKEESSLKYIVTVNGKETDSYTVDDNKVITINQSYNGEEGSYKFSNQNDIIDLSHAIYGDYKIIYKVVSSADENVVLAEKEITIHYNGDNSELLNEYTDLTYNDGTYSIKGKDTKLTTKDILESFDNSINSNFYIIYKSSNGGEEWKYMSISVVDEEKNPLGYNEEVTSNNKIFFGLKDVGDLYSIKIDGDYTNDDIVNEDDANKIIDNILNNETKDDGSVFSIIDATNSVFTTGIWDNSPSAQDELESTISNKSEVYQGEEFDVKYYINGFDKDYLSGIQGKINYDKDKLELTNIELTNKYGGYTDEGIFAYLLDNYNTNGLFMTLKFKGTAAGVANISIDDLLLSNGNILNIDTDSISTKVTIIKLPKGSDVEETTNEESTTTNNSPQATNTTNRIIEPVYIPRYVALSSDNYIKSLKIDGYKIDFDMYKYEYQIKVKNNVKSLKLDIELNDPNATYEVKGNDNFKVGDNTVEIIVTAENGEKRTYTIKVTRENKEEETKEENKGFAKPIIITLIILVIIGLIYVIFKDDEEEDKGSKK